VYPSPQPTTSTAHNADHTVPRSFIDAVLHKILAQLVSDHSM
jgi:hypothetical protein